MPTTDEILLTIRTSIRAVIAEKLSHRGLLEVTQNNARQLVDELARNAAQGVVALAERDERDRHGVVDVVDLDNDMACK